MRRLRNLVWLLAAVALAAGCGSSSSQPKSTREPNGEAAKPAAQILADAKHAAATASSVHAVGHGAEGTGQGSLEVSIVRGGRAEGKFQLSGGSVEMIRSGSKVYVHGDSGFWRIFGDVGLPLARITDHWVVAQASAPAFSGLTGVMSWSGFIARLNLTGKLAKGGVKTFHGQQAIALRDVTEGGTLYVSTTGKPYPLGIVGGQASVSVVFDHWSQPLAIPGPPKNAKPILGR
jgi:hypothetical protein